MSGVSWSVEELPLRKAVFLDRDGVINENRRDYVKSWDQFEFLPGALASLRRLANTPYAIVVLSNQSAINRGLVSWAEVNAINDRMLREIKQAGGRIDGVYVCPHCPDEACDCRKPKPGLLYQAADELGIDLASSYLVGDALCDMQAALTARCVPLLVLTGRGKEELVRAHDARVVDFVYFPDLLQAVDFILGLPSDRATRQPPAPQRSPLSGAKQAGQGKDA